MNRPPGFSAIAAANTAAAGLTGRALELRSRLRTHIRLHQFQLSGNSWREFVRPRLPFSSKPLINPGCDSTPHVPRDKNETGLEKYQR
jgi:hypothetical protein